jgi:hypothetical protein
MSLRNQERDCRPWFSLLFRTGKQRTKVQPRISSYCNLWLDIRQRLMGTFGFYIDSDGVGAEVSV